MALPRRCAASLRLADIRSTLFHGVSDLSFFGHRPVEFFEAFRQVIDLPRIGVPEALRGSLTQ
jgi:hypothetical protein